MSILDDIGRKLDPRKGGGPPGVPNPGDEVKHLIQSAQREIDRAKDGALRDIERAGQKAVREVESNLQDALKEVLRVLQSGFLKRYVQLLDAAAPDSASPQIGPVSFTVDDVRSKFKLFRYWASHPPTGKGQLREMIQQLGPDTVTVVLTVSVPVVDSLQAGGSLTWKTAEFLRRLDDLV